MPNSVDRGEYNKVRSAFNNHDDSDYEDWYVGAVGFLASYNGRWFDGGYARSGYVKTKNGLRYRDYYREAKDNLLNQSLNLKDIQFTCTDYRAIKVTNSFIYCDPPYANTKQFLNSQKFDYDEFWQTMRIWSKTNTVYISELEAPSDFEYVWQKDVQRSMKSTDNTMRAVEKLFRYKGA